MKRKVKIPHHIIRYINGFFILTIAAYPAFAVSVVKDLARFETAKKYFRQGTIHYNRMNYLAAAEFFRKAVKEYPDYYTARDHLARSYRLAGFTDAALREWESLQDAMPDNVAVAGKIETIRFQGTSPITQPKGTEYVFQETYRSSRFPRYRFNAPVGIAVDGEKNVYLTSFSDGSLVKIDGNGTPQFSIKTSLNAKLYGVAVRGERVAVTDFAHDKVVILDRRGSVIAAFGRSGAGAGEFHGPEGICFDSAGNLYVVDAGNGRVQKFDETGAYILQFGKKGEYEGEFASPCGVAVLHRRVYVTDTVNRRVSCFDDSGNFIEHLPIAGLESPRGISAFANTLLIADEKKGLLMYDTVEKSSSWFEVPADAERIRRPVAALVDRDGFLYCVDHDRNAVHLFSPAKTRYSNLDIEITSVDTASFPVVALYVHVRGRDGRPVYGLDASNFHLTEDGAPIMGLSANYLKKFLPSVSIALCVDRSRQAEAYRGDVPWAADFILTKMRKNDSVEVVHFNRTVWQASAFDWSRRRTLKALKERSYGEGKNVGSALYASISDVAGRLNRRGVVLITDGSVEEGSFRTYSVDTVKAYAKAHYVPIFVVSFKEPSRELRQLAEETGGAVFRPTDADGLRSIYSRVKNAEEYRYVLVYPTFKLPSFSGWWSDLKLEVRYKGQRGVEWGGYFVP